MTAADTASSGLTRAEVASLSTEQAVSLSTWQRQHEGAAGFVPQAVRRMPLTTRLELAGNPSLNDAWVRRELQRIASDARYFVSSYGSVEPPRGAPLPFVPWPAQLEVLDTLADHEKVWVLKARRLGLTWLVLHYGFWLAAYNPETPGARVLVFCKNRPDAGKLLDRVKAIHDRLPSWARQHTGRDSVTALELPARDAELVALPATEAAARQETATLVVLDEFAFAKNGTARGIWTAVQPTIEGGGQLVGISTGNGTTGDGATFAQVWDDANSGRNGVRPVFLPWNARPDRTPEWREAQRADYLSDDEFHAEYPDTPDQALAGHTAVTVYPTSAINAAVRLAHVLANQDDTLAELRAEGYEFGTDWGDFQTFTVYALPLPGGGVYVVDELVQSHVEPSRAADAILSHNPADDPTPTFTASRADSAPAGTNATFTSVLANRRAQHPGKYPTKHVRVPFSKFKEGGGERRGVNTVAFIRRSLEASAAVPDDWTTTSDLSGCLLIDERCHILLAQLKGLERDSETGKVRKPALNPNDTSKGDHGPDSLVALLAGRAGRWTAAAHDRRGTADD